MTEKDPRIGKDNEWPAVTLSGLSYSRPASTVHFSDGRFIVLDTFPPRNEEELIQPFLKQAVKLTVVPPPEDSEPFAEDAPDEQP